MREGFILERERSAGGNVALADMTGLREVKPDHFTGAVRAEGSIRGYKRSPCLSSVSMASTPLQRRNAAEIVGP